jgi:hypothetical protein
MSDVEARSRMASVLNVVLHAEIVAALAALRPGASFSLRPVRARRSYKAS